MSARDKENPAVRSLRELAPGQVRKILVNGAPVEFLMFAESEQDGRGQEWRDRMWVTGPLDERLKPVHTAPIGGNVYSQLVDVRGADVSLAIR